jgi:hypothetical protein
LFFQASLIAALLRLNESDALEFNPANLASFNPDNIPLTIDQLFKIFDIENKVNYFR